MEQAVDTDVAPLKKKNGIAKIEAAPPPAPLSETAAVMHMIERMMTDPSIMPERMVSAFDFYQKVKADAARRAFDAAMADAKAEIPPIFKNRGVDFTSQKGRTNYRHEDLSEIARTVDPILGRYGLSYRFSSKVAGEKLELTCKVTHRDGHCEETSLPAPFDATGNKNFHQSIGSAATYLQRYTLKIALGLSATTDDDGRTASTVTDMITDAQSEEIMSLITETNSDWGKFRHRFKIATVSDLTAKGYEEALALLNAKKSKATS